MSRSGSAGDGPAGALSGSTRQPVADPLGGRAEGLHHRFAEQRLSFLLRLLPRGKRPIQQAPPVGRDAKRAPAVTRIHGNPTSLLHALEVTAERGLLDEQVLRN